MDILSTGRGRSVSRISGPKTRSDDSCLAYFTSGTVGYPKMVLLCANFPPLSVKPGSMGKPSPGFEVSVIDHDGSELPPNKEGDIAVKVKPQRPTWMFKEYWRNPDATQAYVILAPGYTASPELATELQEHVKRVTMKHCYR